MSTINERHPVTLGHLPCTNWLNGTDLQIRHAKVLRKIFSAHAYMRRHIPHPKTLDPLGNCNPRRSTLSPCAKPFIPLPIPRNLGPHRCQSGCLASHWLFGATALEPRMQPATFVCTEAPRSVVVALRATPSSARITVGNLMRLANARTSLNWKTRQRFPLKQKLPLTIA